MEMGKWTWRPTYTNGIMVKVIQTLTRHIKDNLKSKQGECEMKRVSMEKGRRRQAIRRWGAAAEQSLKR